MAPPRKPLYIGYNYYKEDQSSSKQALATTHHSSKSGREMKESTQLHTATKSIYKSDKGNKASTTLKNTFSSDEFVDKSTGRLGFKEEMTCTRRDKYDNKNDGYTHEYETQVKFKHVAYPNKPYYNTNKQININTNTSQISYDGDDDYY